MNKELILNSQSAGLKAPSQEENGPKVEKK